MPKGNNSWGIYIGNIPCLLTKEHIEGLFKKYNIVETDEIHSNGTKTFCFMKLRGEADIANAVAEMNNHNVNGRKLQVRRFENKQRSAKQEQELSNCDTKRHCSSLTVNDIPPLLEMSFRSQNKPDSRKHYSNNKFEASGYGHQNSSSSTSHLTSHASPQASGHCNPVRDNFCMSPQAQNSRFNSHNQSNGTSDFLPNKKNTQRSPSGQCSQMSPHGKNTELRSGGQWKGPPSPNKSAPSQQSERTPQSSADHDQSSRELPERYRYVHCTRNVISYNPRDLENNKIRLNSFEHSSSEVVKVWAANFPFGTTKNQMLKLFEDFSPLKVCINNNAPGGDFTRATITLPSLDAAETAIMELDNTIYKRRTLLVGLVEEGDEFAEDDDDEEEEEYDDYYYEPYGDYREQDYHHRSQEGEQLYYEEPISRRFHNIHLS